MQPSPELRIEAGATQDPPNVRIEQCRAQLEKDDQEGQPEPVDVRSDVPLCVRLNDPALHERVVAFEGPCAPFAFLEQRAP